MMRAVGGGRRRRLRRLAIVVLGGMVAAAGISAWQARSELGWMPAHPRASGRAFLVDPYVQLGDAPREGETESLMLLWQAEDRDDTWSVAVRDGAGGAWRKAGAPSWRRDARPGIAPRRYYQAAMTGLVPGAEFSYHVQRQGARVFEATARARKSAGQPHRFVAFGDGGANTWGERAVAYQAARARPDFVFVTGDLVYYKGLLSEYLDKFFPVYNCDVADPSWGAPLLRSIPMMVAPGNHDLIECDLDAHPDALAYFLVWSLPSNGPITAPGARNAPALRGSEAHRRAFLDVAGPAYPRAANYAFDYGGVHWTVLDTNPYADWSDPSLRAWLEADLASAQGASWRFVAFHQPPFHSSKAHADEQRTRVLAGLFEKHNVDIVFSGHIHNYQRTYPLRFTADGPVRADGLLPGHWTLDRAFDGRTRTRPDGVIYLVTGAGGARLYDSQWRGDPTPRESFTARFVSSTHSLTIVDVDDRRLFVRQVSGEGTEIDRFTVTR